MQTADNTPITIVSGLPRSGTSMMMMMLEAGGQTPLTDNIRTADDDNPRGYYELEQVKKGKADHSWLDAARGKVVKVISYLLVQLPDTHAYKVVFMHRAIPEVLASQRTMMKRRGLPPDEVDDVTMTLLFEKDLRRTKAWLTSRPAIQVLDIAYADVLANPLQEAQKISAFFDNALDATAMAAVVDKTLYRQQTSASSR